MMLATLMGRPSRAGAEVKKGDLERLKTMTEGGSGSGNFGHAGRPGEVGGSSPSGATTVKGLTPDEADAMRYYVERAGYMHINHALRHGKSISGEAKKMVPILDKLTNRKLDEMTVFRGISPRAFGRLKVGMTFTDKGFASTSKNLKTASCFGYFAMKIRVPAGSKGFDIGSRAGKGYKEQEVLLRRNSQFRIDKISSDPGGHNVVSVEATLVGQR